MAQWCPLHSTTSLYFSEWAVVSNLQHAQKSSYSCTLNPISDGLSCLGIFFQNIKFHFAHIVILPHTRIHTYKIINILYFLYLLSYVPPFFAGAKWSAGVLCDPWLHQAGAFAVGSGSSGRWPMARPPAGAERRPQRSRDSLCCHSAARLWTLSGNSHQ